LVGALALPAALALLALATAANSNALMAQRTNGDKPGEKNCDNRRTMSADKSDGQCFQDQVCDRIGM
jgi:hypothetical protein